MPNMDILLDNTAQFVKSDANYQTLLSTPDLRYAYSQILSGKRTRAQFYFSLIEGYATRTYQFQTGFFGLTDIPAEFQKAIILTRANCKIYMLN